MKPPFPSLTPTWHNDTYPSIDPRSAENSQAGKTIIVTGAGSGIGRETAIAFAIAGAKHVILVGRTESTLLETESQLPSNGCKSTVCVASVSDAEQMKKVVEVAGTWDVFVLNAGHLPRPTSIVEADIDDWWASYETNVKALLLTAKLFLPTANPSSASLLGVNAGGIILPPSNVVGLSAYMTSKIAQAKLMEWLAVENPNLFTCSIQPGVVDTKMLRDSGLSGLPLDSVQLPAHFLVWLAQPKARFLNGRFVWANWDVDELCEIGDEIEGSEITRITASGWPYRYKGQQLDEA
ncbi:NAD(P)-binding protein [Lophiostoma macrostomum CBS 122681]|uniref:NAD(P)-binding protein n=1 Tax=Lophiostoma macrostomum CBS 122681 TaxID=1314788 RepID=A0A6A6SNL9_9PLEO|nr:NAD(P)-binding protein [Lophiostoma macrostomum CBS 122681]